MFSVPGITGEQLTVHIFKQMNLEVLEQASLDVQHISLVKVLAAVYQVLF